MQINYSNWHKFSTKLSNWKPSLKKFSYLLNSYTTNDISLPSPQILNAFYTCTALCLILLWPQYYLAYLLTTLTVDFSDWRTCSRWESFRRPKGAYWIVPFWIWIGYWYVMDIVFAFQSSKRDRLPEFFLFSALFERFSYPGGWILGKSNGIVP